MPVKGGYYVNGIKQYEKKYSNGKLISNNNWSEAGKKEVSGKVYKRGWTSSERTKAEEILCKKAPNQDECDCVLAFIIDELSFKEFQILDNSSGLKDPNINENLRKRAMELTHKFQECIKRPSINEESIEE